MLGGSTDNELCKLAWRREHKDLHRLSIWQFADTKGALVDGLGVRSRDGIAHRYTFIVDPENTIQHVYATSLMSAAARRTRYAFWMRYRLISSALATAKSAATRLKLPEATYRKCSKEQLPNSKDVRFNRFWIQTILPQMRPAASEYGTQFNSHCRHAVCRGRRAVRARQSLRRNRQSR
ncbi:hypothetical protein ABIA94_009243 [Bradyrhizobium sp. LA7.1]